MPSQEVQQWAEEYMTRDRLKRAEKAKDKIEAWEASLQAQSYIHTSPTPEEMVGFYEVDPLKMATAGLDPAARSIAATSGIDSPEAARAKENLYLNPSYQKAQDTYVQAMEQVYTGERQDLGLDFFLQFTEQEIWSFAPGGEYAGLASTVAQVQANMANDADVTARIEERFEQEKINWENMEGMYSNLSLISGPGALPTIGGKTPHQLEQERQARSPFDAEGVKSRITLEEWGRGDELFEDEIDLFLDASFGIMDRARAGEDVFITQRDFVAQESGFGQTESFQSLTHEGKTLSQRDFFRFTAQELSFLEVAGVDDIADLDDEEYANLKDLREQALRQQLQANPTLTDVLTPGLGTGFVMGAMEGFGAVIEKGLQFGGAVFQGFDWVSGGEVVDGMRQGSRERQEAAVAEYQKQTGAPATEILAPMTMGDAQEAWEALNQQNPEVSLEYVQMGGGLEEIGFALFQADWIGEIKPEDQIKFVQAQYDAEADYTRQLREQDFSVGTEVLNTMATYGRLVPGRLSTWATLLISDSVDMHSETVINGVGDFMHELERQTKLYDYQPSAVLGIDGSLAGLMLDLGSGIAFDPVTWFTGPRLGAMGAKVGSFVSAKALAKSPIIRQLADDVIIASMSPSKGASAMYALGEFLDGTSFGEYLNLIGYNAQTLPFSPWKTTAGARRGLEVQTSFLHKFVPESRLGDDLTGLADNIKTKGFEEMVDVKISRTTKDMWIDDGVKRVVAADQGGISHVPIRFTVVDDVPVGVTKIAGHSDDAVAAYQRVAALGDDSRHVTGLADDAVQGNVFGAAEAMKKFQPDEIGTAGSKTLKNGDEVSIKFVDDGTEGIWWAEDADGNVVGAAQTAGGTATAPGMQSQGVFSSIMDSARETGLELFSRLDMDAISPQGLRATQGYARRQLAKKLPDTGAEGALPVEAMLREGEELAREFLKPGGGTSTAIRVDSVLPRRLVMGDVPWDDVYELFQKAIVDRGVMPAGAEHSAIARFTSRHIKELLRSNAPGQWLERWMTPQYLGTNFALVGPHAIKKITESMYRIWGDDTAKLNQWLERVMVAQKEVARKSGESAKRIDELRPQMQAYRSGSDMVGDMWDEVSSSIDDSAEMVQAQANRAQLKAVVNDMDKDLKAKLTTIDRETSVLGHSDDLNQIMIDMYEDYNRTHIGPRWGKKDGEMVPWDDLRRGRRKPSDAAAQADDSYFSTSMLDAAEEMGIKVETLTAKLSNNQNINLTANMPVSPLELVVASELFGSKWIRFSQTLVGSKTREWAFNFQRAWVMDKVMTPATAATVSIDELMRGFNLGGSWSGQARWLRDRGIFLNARARAAVEGHPLRRSTGSARLKAKRQQRITDLQDYPTLLKQAERQVYEQGGTKWVDIAPNQIGYDDAARRWTAGFLQDSGFRAFLKGEAAFSEWFLSPDGARLRGGSVVGKRNAQVETMMITEAAEHFRGWQSSLDVILSEATKAGKYDEVLSAWREVARKIDESGGLPKDLPDAALQHLGPIRGVRREQQGQMGIRSMSDAFFDTTFMDPVNYRRGFLAEMTRTHETSRLRSLFETGGKRIVTDAEMESIFGLTGLQGGSRAGLHAAAQEMALKAGYIPESYIDDLAEQAVLREIENTLYSFEQGSRLGTQARAVFPFGKPWADMAAFWGREVLRKPQLRGWINESNFLKLRTLNERGYLAPIVPNRAGAMISRMAHQDFTIDKGLIGGEGEGALHEGGLLPGSEKSDFSPLFFLPTAGDNPLSVMIPGMGILPIFMLDMFLTRGLDPVEDALEYQERLDKVGEIIPAVHFQQGGAIGRVLGGGATSKLALGVTDLVGMSEESDSSFFVTSVLGDISREIDRTREISALLADPDELELILSAETPEEANALINSLVQLADNQASGNHFVETVARYMAPVNATYDTALHEIQDVWFDVDALMQTSHLGGQDPENMTAEDRRTLANDIRTDFFALENWQRDALIVRQPSLAVNVVGSWEWVPAARNANLSGTDYSYRPGGSRKDLARHETLVRRGLIRPAVPVERAKRIIGTIHNATVNTAKALYESELETVNTQLWEERVSDGTKLQLELLLETDFAKDWGLRTVEEVWMNWNKIEEDWEFWRAELEGIDAVRGPSTRKDDLTEFDKLRRQIKIPQGEKPWGSTWPGLEEENVSGRFNQWVLDPSPKTRELAFTLGIHLYAGMTGEDLFGAAQQSAARTSPAFSVTQANYDRYRSDRVVNTGRNQLQALAQSTEVQEDWQENIQQWLFKDNLMGQRVDEDRRNGLSLADQQKMRDEYLYMWNGSKDESLDWEQIWTEQYERRYGPLDWVAPVPQSPLNDDGSMRPGVMAPQIRHVVDGDTLLINEFPGSPTNNSVRLLGIRAEESSGPNGDIAFEQENELKDAILQAGINGDRIYLVRDERFGNTDRYGRMLAWLWIGDTPYYNEEDLRPHQDPSGGDN